MLNHSEINNTDIINVTNLILCDLPKYVCDATDTEIFIAVIASAALICFSVLICLRFIFSDHNDVTDTTPSLLNWICCPGRG